MNEMTASHCDSLKGSDRLRSEKKLRCLYNAADKENMHLEALDPHLEALDSCKLQGS